MLTQVENSRTGLGFQYAENCTFPLAATSAFSAQEIALPNPSFLSLPICFTPEREGLFWPVGSSTDTATKRCSGFVTSYQLTLPLRCDDARQGTTGPSATLTGKTGDFPHPLPLPRPFTAHH